MAPEKKLDFAIIGGGIAGLTLAIALHHRGLKVKIYEQAQEFGEIGAGVSFSPNALQAMKICHPGVHQAFEKVCTRNIWPSKRNVWFDYHDGHSKVEDPKGRRAAFSILNSLGQNGVHRARFLDEIIPLIPPELAVFGKRLDDIIKNDSGTLSLRFSDGSESTAHAVIGCDGIKSRVRQLIFGSHNPCAFPSYTYKYAFRAMIPMEDAIKVLGEEQAKNSCMHMGPGGHMLTFPVDHGQILNVVAFHTAEEDWPDYQKLTAPSKRETALKDFGDFGKGVLGILGLAKPDINVWAIFDLGKDPLPTYAKVDICLVGDAAHATSPHHGAGAGMCIEDSAVLAELLADERVKTQQDVELAFQAYDQARRPRTQWLVQSSRFIGDCYEWRAEGVEDDLYRVEAEINRRNSIISNVDVSIMCDQARDIFATLAKASRKSDIFNGL